MVLLHQRHVSDRHDISVLYALSLAGISPKDTKFQKALRALLEKVDRLSVNDTTTYELGLGILALEIIDRKRFRKEIAKMRGILINRQADSGGWDYRAPSYMQTGNRQQQRTDWSNSQFAILALTAAERAEALAAMPTSDAAPPSTGRTFVNT
ncbi:MAG: hypothetical protein U5N86_08225 [Planctomycetota bacterium]|nr:hypothetical protein [Planctomycetota bacterium]